MEMLSTITIVSVIMWYIIDRLKPMWQNLPMSKYITTAMAACFAGVLSFGYQLDIMQALGIVDTISAMGMVMTALTLMGGSSAVSELIGKIKT